MPARAKRLRGEGTIFRDTERGLWRGQLPPIRDPVTGKIHRVTARGKTAKEVSDILAAKRAEMAGRIVSVTARSPLRDYLESWLEAKRPSLRPRIGQRYGELLRPFSAVIGHLRLENLNAQDVNGAMAALSRRRDAKGQLQWDAATINRMREVLRNALNDAIRAQQLNFNAAKAAQPLKTQEHQPVVIGDPESMRQFLETAEGEKFKIISRPHITALLTGFRIGEIGGLKWSDVNGSTLTINREIQRIRKSLVATLPPSYERWGGLVLMEPKTKLSTRSIDVSHKVVQLFADQRQTQAVWKSVAGSNWQENDFIFTTRKGTPIDPGELLGQLKRILEKAEMLKMRFHDLRHSLVVLLTIQGVPPAAILKITGWSNISQLQRYAKWTKPMGEQAVAAIDSVLEASGQIGAAPHS